LAGGNSGSHSFRREVIVGKTLIFESLKKWVIHRYLQGLHTARVPIVITVVLVLKAIEECLMLHRLITHRYCRTSLLVLLGALFGAAQAQSLPDYQSVALRWARDALKSSQVASPASLRFDVTVGPMDPRLKLAACQTVEPYLPVGARLWGKSRIGLRCLDTDTRWNISLAVAVKAIGVAWTVRNPVAPGVAIQLGDVVQTEVDWAEESAPVLGEAATWEGQVATRLLSTGQTLRQGMVKAPQVFQAGAQIRVITQGRGFEASADAQALSAGVLGQPARVRLENGRVATGLVLDVNTVKLEL
jgi:flagella basal body P-ring formation protein FlgA